MKTDKCKCGLLGQWIKDGSSKFTVLENSDACVLALNSEIVIVNYCPICGGRELGIVDRGQECTCGSVSKWAQAPDTQIRYDKELNEYWLVTGNGKTIFYYCLSCGGCLPKSKRAEFFTTPSSEESALIREKVGPATSLDEVMSILGEPDEKYDAITHDPQQKQIYGIRDLKREIRYTSLAETLVLDVQEYEDGEIMFLFSGKLKIDISNTDSKSSES